MGKNPETRENFNFVKTCARINIMKRAKAHFPKITRRAYLIIEFFKTLFKGNKNMRQFGVAHEI